MRKKLTLMFVALMAIAAFAATQAIRRGAAEKSYTITFKDTGTSSDASEAISTIADMVATGADYVTEVTKAEKVSLGRSGRGLKLGTSKVNGELTLKLANAVKPTKVVVKARKYNDKGENTININGKEFTLSEGNGEDCTVDYDGNTEVSEIAITAPNHRTYVISITVYYNEEQQPDPIPVIEGSIVYDFAAAATAGENPANKNGSAANGQAFYAWESSSKTDSKRQDYKGYEWAEGSKLPEVCHVWRRSDRINSNIKNGGLDCPSNKEMVIDGLNPSSIVYIYYDATNAAEDSKNIIWAAGTEHGAKATIDGVDAVSGETTIASGAKIEVKDVVPADNGTGYIAFQVKKGMVIKQIVVVPAPDPIYVIGGNGNWDLTNMTLINYSQETKAFEFTLDVKGIAFFAISDVKAMAAGNDWDGFVAHRYAIAAGDNDATLDTETQLVNANGAIAVRGYGKYKVSITEDKKMTITAVEHYPLYVIGTMNEWNLEKMPEMTFNETSQTYDYLIQVEEGTPYYFAVSDVESSASWDDFGAHRYGIDSGDQTITIGEEKGLGMWSDGTIVIDQPGSYAISVSSDLSKIKVAAPVPVDIVVNAEAGDLTNAIAEAEENKVAKSLTLNLKENTEYTVSEPITASTDIVINGKGATIDASNVAGALISYQAPAAAAAPALRRATLKEAWADLKSTITVKDLTINSLANALFEYKAADNKRFDINIDNVVAQVTADKIVFDVSKSGAFVENLNINNSTFYAPEGTSQSFFSAQSAKNGGDVYDNAKDGTALQTFNFTNSTFYKFATKKNFFTLRQSGQVFLAFNLQKNIFVDCGKDGQTIKGFNQGQGSTNPQWTVDMNTFMWGGANKSDAEVTGDTDEPATNNLPTDPEFADAANGDFHVGAGTAQAKEQTGDPRWLEGVVYDATKMPAKDIEIAANKITDGDITAAIAAAYNSDYQKVGSVTLNLIAGNYTITESIAPTGSVKITGAGAGGDKGDLDATVIDASQLTAPFVQMSKSPTAAPNANGFYEIGNIVFENVKIKDLKQQLFYANKTKYLIPELKVNNSVILIDGGSKNIFDTNGGGVIAKLNVEETTIASPTAMHTGYLYTSQSGQKATEAGLEEQVLSFKNATIYQIANSKNTCNHRQSGQTWLKFNVENCLVVNSGKNGQFVLGLNGGQNSNNPTWTVKNSSFAWDGKDVAEAEVGIAAKCEKATFTDIVYGMPFFRKDITQGIFTLGICLQISKSVGDPRWYNIPMITNLRNALARAAELLDGAQEDWASAPAINEAVENLAAAYNDNKEYLESNYQEAIDEATARVEAAIAEFNKSMGDVTAIESVNAAKTDNAAWYTVNGQRVDRPAQKGLYIHNGRKVVIK